MLHKLPLTLLLLLALLVKSWGQDQATTRLNTLFSEIDSAVATFNYDKYELLLHKADTLSNNIDKPILRIKALRKLAQLYAGNGTHTKKDLTKALIYANIGLAVAEDINTEEHILNLKYVIGSINMLQSNYTKTLKIFNEIDFKVSDKDYDFIPFYYTSFARLHYYLEELPLAFEKLKKASSIYEQRKDIRNASAIYNNLGILYKAQKQFDSSLVYHYKSLKISEATKDFIGIAYSYNNIGQVYFSKENPIKAEQYYKKALDINPKNPSPSLLNNFSEVLIFQGKYNNAENILKNITKDNPDNNAKVLAFNNLISIYKLQKNYKEALVYSDSLLNCKEAIINTTKIKEIEKLKAEHDTEKKAKQIELLSTQNNNQELKLRKNQILLTSILIGVVLLAMISSLFFRNKIIQTRADKLLLEQQLLRSQMNPHFIFNALSNIQTSILKNENQKAAIYLTKFSKLVRSILENTKKRAISFSEELEAITHYLELQKSRFENEFNYDITIDPEIDKDFTMIPAMLFQPIIENAIEHGIESVDSGMININFSLKNKHIHCTVIDNGIGYSNTFAKTNENKTSLSSINIKDRLAYYSKKLKYPFMYCIKDHCLNNTIIGTIASIDIPIIES